jgi:hypothetical protein
MDWQGDGAALAFVSLLLWRGPPKLGLGLLGLCEGVAPLLGAPVVQGPILNA